MSGGESFITNDPGDAKFMALMERFSERLDWMKGDAAQRNRQLEMQAATLNALEKGMSKMEGMIGGMRDELRTTSQLAQRVAEVEKRLSRVEDRQAAINGKVDALVEFKDSIINKLAKYGLLCFIGGGGLTALAIKIMFGGAP